MDIGSIAGMCTIIAFVPQVIKLLRTKDATSLSLPMCCIQTLGIALWVLHGILIKDASVTISNLITLCLVSSILVAKLRYK